MSKQITTELWVGEITEYPGPATGPKKFMIIEYEVIKKEIKRYIVEVK